MIEKINMYNHPRQSGKTSNLKLKAITASRELYDYIFIVTHNIDSRREIDRWFNDLSHHGIITQKCSGQIGVFTSSELISYLKGTELDNILVLIDEPFEIDIPSQINLMQTLEVQRTKFHIIGFGTDRTPKLFKDYIVNNDKLISF